MFNNEKTRSVAADEGCTNNIFLHVLLHLGSVPSCDFHHLRTSTSSETSSAAARYSGYSDFKPLIASVFGNGKAAKESISLAVGLSSFTFEGER